MVKTIKQSPPAAEIAIKHKGNKLLLKLQIEITEIFTGVKPTCKSAIAWMAERLFRQANLITTFVGQAAQYSRWLVALLAITAMVSFVARRKDVVRLY